MAHVQYFDKTSITPIKGHSEIFTGMQNYQVFSSAGVNSVILQSINIKLLFIQNKRTNYYTLLHSVNTELYIHLCMSRQGRRHKECLHINTSHDFLWNTLKNRYLSLKEDNTLKAGHRSGSYTYLRIMEASLSLSCWLKYKQKESFLKHELQSSVLKLGVTQRTIYLHLEEGVSQSKKSNLHLHLVMSTSRSIREVRS